MNRNLVIRALPLVLVLVAAACGASVPTPAAGPGAHAPADAVERFLRSAAAPDYLEMGWVFGTEKGPIIRRDPPRDVEKRMHAVARILENEQFTIRAPSPVPGRIGTALRLDVALTKRGREYVVPFTVVRGPGQRWFVEDVKLDVITGR
jgi:hypothetical protein